MILPLAAQARGEVCVGRAVVAAREVRRHALPLVAQVRGLGDLGVGPVGALAGMPTQRLGGRGEQVCPAGPRALHWAVTALPLGPTSLGRVTARCPRPGGRRWGTRTLVYARRIQEAAAALHLRRTDPGADPRRLAAQLGAIACAGSQPRVNDESAVSGPSGLPPPQEKGPVPLAANLHGSCAIPSPRRNDTRLARAIAGHRCGAA